MEFPNQVLRKSLEVGGRQLILESGRLARQAGSSVLASYGETVVLVAATTASIPREGIDFFPLTIDYEERLYAVGRIPGGFIKREGRPSERAILSARLIDRPIRPLFPKGYRKDVHVVATVLSMDQDNQPDTLAINAASTALTLSAIPFSGPIAGVTVGLIDGVFIINPTLEQAERSKLHLIVAGTSEAVIMVEAGACEVPEDIMLEAIMQGHDKIREIITFIQGFCLDAEKLGLAKTKEEFISAEEDSSLFEDVRARALTKLRETILQGSIEGWHKQEREERYNRLKHELFEGIWQDNAGVSELERNPNTTKIVHMAIERAEKEIVRQLILEGRRVDGRGPEDIRPIKCEVGILPRTHGTGLFTRGETQVLTVATLGAVGDEQILDGLGVEESKRYMHHYNMPPYSVGEARPMRGPGRREIGHGALAERALLPVIPSEEQFPYTIRLVSEVVGSNGSTSMGSVCGSTLSLMDAGVPIKEPVAGVAMGLVMEDNKVIVLSDIQGLEDALGDMDFKVAGTRNGITALQMDIKIAGISREILNRALDQALRGRLYILERMLEAIPGPRPTLSPYAPRIIRMQVDPEKIRDIIGSGGKTIKKIIDITGAKIDIEDDGTVFIAATDGTAGQKTVEIIEQITQDVEVGNLYNGRVTRVTDFGAFVEVIPGVLGLPGKEGLVHISHLAEGRVDKVEDVVHEGEEILVKAIGFDPQGRLRLSHKEAIGTPSPGASQTRPPRPADMRNRRRR